MSERPFQKLSPNVRNNDSLRRPQRESFEAIAEHYSSGDEELQVGIVLPVGCGKSGAITLTPFATKAQRVLVIAPGVRIARQLLSDFDITSERVFPAKPQYSTVTAYQKSPKFAARRRTRPTSKTPMLSSRTSSSYRATTIGCCQSCQKISSTSSSTTRHTIT